MCISKTLFNMSSLTTIEKRYGITLRKAYPRSFRKTFYFYKV